MYACETWMTKYRDKELLKAFEMKCYKRKLLKIHWTQKITNVEVTKQLGIKANIFQMMIE